MDPATVLALVNLVKLGLDTFSQFSNGTITAEQATAMLNQASDNLKNAIDAFNAAGQEPPKPAA